MASKTSAESGSEMESQALTDGFHLVIDALKLNDINTIYELSALYEVPPHRLLTEAPAPRREAISPDDAADPALDQFRRELTAMRELDLLPLDDETIEYCVVKMRARLDSEKQQNN